MNPHFQKSPIFNRNPKNVKNPQNPQMTKTLYQVYDFADWVVIPASSPRMTKWSTKMAPHETPQKSQYTYTTPHEMTIFGFRSRKTENSSKAAAE